MRCAVVRASAVVAASKGGVSKAPSGPFHITVRHFASRMLGPTLDILGTSIELLRHEVEPVAPRRFDWSVTGAWVIMGLTGLAATLVGAYFFPLV